MNLLFCFPIPKEVKKKKEKQHFCNYQELSGTQMIITYWFKI